MSSRVITDLFRVSKVLDYLLLFIFPLTCFSIGLSHYKLAEDSSTSVIRAEFGIDDDEGEGVIFSNF